MIEFGGSSVWSLTSLWLNECNSLTKRNFLFRIHRTDGRTDMKTTVIQQFRDQINMILMISSHEELHLPSLNGPSSVSFSFIFVLSNKHYNFYNKYMWKFLWPSSIRRQDFNPQPLEPLEHKSPPITTRPGLPPYQPEKCCKNKFTAKRDSNWGCFVWEATAPHTNCTTTTSLPKRLKILTPHTEGG